jgi:integrase
LLNSLRSALSEEKSKKTHIYKQLFRVEIFGAGLPLSADSWKNRGKNLKRVRLRWKNTQGHDDMANFKTKSDVAKMIPPAFKGDYWSSAQEGFGIRIGAKKLDGSYQKEYLARWRDEHGKDQRPTIGRYSELEFNDAAEIARKRVAFEKRRVNDIKRGVEPMMTMNQAYQRYVDENRLGWSATTLQGYDSRWKNVKAFHDRPMDEVTSAEWLDMYIDLLANNGPVAARAAHDLVRNVYEYFVNDDEAIIDKNPCLNLKRMAKKRNIAVPAPKKRTRHITLEQMPDYFTSLTTHAQPGQRDYVLFALLTGFRASLLGSLAWSRLNMKDRTYHVEAVDKGNKSKVAFDYPICDFLWQRVIEPRLAIRRPECPWIIESPHYPCTPLHSVRGTHEKMERLVGVKLSDHDLRKTFGSVAYLATKDLLTVQRLLTHSIEPINRETEMTERYVMTAKTTFREAVEKAAEQFLLLTKRETGAKGTLPEPTLDYELKKQLEYQDEIEAEAAIAEAMSKNKEEDKDVAL